MGRRRSMPSRAKIFEYWKDKINNAKNDNTCFKCGITSLFEDTVIVDRAHILAVCEGGSDDVDNLHLLCRNCHRESEAYNGSEYKLWITSKNREEFAKSLYVLWHDKDIINDRLDLYFNKVKDNFIKETSKDMFDFQMECYKEESKEHISIYHKSLS